MTALLDSAHTTTGAEPAGAPRAAFRLRRRAYRVTLVSHVLASVGWFGIAVAVLAATLTGAATADPSLARSLYTVIATAPFLSVPAGLVAVATGTVLGLGTVHGLARRWWVLAKTAIAVVVIATDATLIGHAAHRAAAGVPGGLLGPTAAHVVVLALAAVLSVFKPWGRTPWANSGHSAAKPARTASNRPQTMEQTTERPVMGSRSGRPLPMRGP